jgi:Spy/CpxP family protein refolding chaperone
LRFFALHSLDLLTINQEDENMTTFKTLIKTTLTPIALCLSLAIAVPAIAHKSHHQRHDGMRQILSELSLTDTQKQDIKQILKQSREDRNLFKTDNKSLKTELRSIIQSSEWDQTAVESALTQRQALTQQKALQRANNKNQVWNLLTETQQVEFIAQLETRKAKREEMGPRDKRKGKGNRLERLGLSTEQLAAVETIKSEAKASRVAIKTGIKTYKEAEQALIHSSGFNTQTWQTLNAQYQADFLSMGVLEAKTKYDIWNLLTPEQKIVAAEKFKGKKGKHGKKSKKHQQQDSV